MSRPKIVCLCGSTRFKQAWYDWTKKLTHQGIIVLGVGDLDPSAPGTNVPIDAELKARLDELHKRKIDLADEVLVLDVPVRTCPGCGKIHADLDVMWCANPCSTMLTHVQIKPYIGASTRSEIEYAVKHGKPVRHISHEHSS